MSNKTENLKRKQQMSDFSSNFHPDFLESKKIKINECKMFLMPLHIVTCGLQGDDLGRDETTILQICVNLIDVSNMQIIGELNMKLQPSSLLDPEADPEKIHISIPAREMTGLTSIPNHDSKIDLREALEEIDALIQNCTINDNQCTIEIIPVTVGDLPLRSVLHRESRFRGIPLQNYWYRYYDLCQQMSLSYQSPFASLRDICAALQMVYNELSVAMIFNISQSVLCLLKYNHIFESEHIIKNNYKPTIFHVDDPVDDDVVIVIKPIDYKTPISQVLPFFNGVNIADGGVAVIMSDGRRSNKILVRLTDKRQRDIALLRDKHHLEPGSTRYITMSTFDSREFMRIAGYDDENVRDYLERLSKQEQVLVRMKGLPFTVTKEDIFQFFNLHDTEIQFGLDGIFLVQKPSGDLNGDSFITFSTDEQATKATNLKGSMIGNRYVEIFYSTPAEMNQVIAGIKTGTNQTKSIKKTNNGRELENFESVRSSYPLSLLNGSLMQNILCNKTNPVNGVTITSLIPVEATDNDFLKFLGEYQSSAIHISRSSVNNPKGCTSYVARFKDIYDAQLALKYLTTKLFKVDLTNQEFQVKTTALPIATVSSIFKTYMNQSPMLQQSPLNALNMIPTVFPLSQALLQPSYNIPNSIPITNGSLINYGAMTNMYSINQYSQLNVLSNALQTNFFNGQMTPQLAVQSPANHSYISAPDLSTSALNNKLLLQALPLVSNLSQTMILDKSSIVLLYGVQIQLSQQDADVLFSSLAPYIVSLPRLYQNNQSFYAIFSSPEDAKTAITRCPVILYKNQAIYLIAIN